jgi:hypothetical protein
MVRNVEFNPKLSFQFDTSKKMFDNLLEEYEDFYKNPLSSRFAMNCAIVSWHLTDWTFHEYFKNYERFQDAVKMDKKKKEYTVSGLTFYVQEISKQCPDIEYMRLITNGVKHCILKDQNTKESTKLREGDFCSLDFDFRDFAVQRYVIETKSGAKMEELDYQTILENVISFWTSFFKGNIVINDVVK